MQKKEDRSLWNSVYIGEAEKGKCFSHPFFFAVVAMIREIDAIEKIDEKYTYFFLRLTNDFCNCVNV